MTLEKLRAIEATLNTGIKQQAVATRHDVSLRTVEDIAGGRHKLQGLHGSTLQLERVRQRFISIETVRQIEQLIRSGATRSEIKATTGVASHTQLMIARGKHHLQNLGGQGPREISP